MAMSVRSPIRVVRLTPPGRGAVATLRVEGHGAVGLVDSFFSTRAGRRLAAFPTDRLAIGRFAGPNIDQPEPGEQVVVRICSGDAVEIHCHGGQAAVARIEGQLVDAGCAVVPWQAWAADVHDDPFVAAAMEPLAKARTERTAAILLDQYQGALRRELDEIQGMIHRGDRSAAAQRCEELLNRARLGRHLVHPWRVVLGGPANVGKSSLVNALVGYTRSIVHDTAGTTRDAVTASTAIDGWPVDLCDTAGLHTGPDPIEQAGIALARKRLADADLVVLVFDRSAPWSDDHQALFDQWPDALVVFNKSDLPALPGLRPAGLIVSAMRGDGLAELLSAISTWLVPQTLPPGAAIPLNANQIAVIRRTAAAIPSC